MIARLITFTTAVAMAVSLAACGGSNAPAGTSVAGGTSGQAAAGTEALKEPVKLRMLVVETGTVWNKNAGNPVAQEIERQTGITFEYVESDDTKFKVLLAGGDLPDIVRTDYSKFAKQMIEGNLVIPLDDLLATNGKDITANIANELEVSREFWSNKTGKIYYITPQVMEKPGKHYLVDIGATFRWDYYKELGCPEIKTDDDLIKVLQEMIAKHPTTEDGKKVYGMSMWSDWGGLWPYIYTSFVFSGEPSPLGSEVMAKKADSTVVNNRMLTEDSAYWQGVKLFYKARKAGVLDPDALTMKYSDFQAKATAGQILFAPSQWSTGDFNKNHTGTDTGFMTVPVGKYAWTGEISPLGWGDKAYCISTSCKTPDRAMDLLNYFFSYDGARTMWSGIKGQDWDIADGKPALKEETIKLKSTGGTEWENTGIQLDVNLIGLGNGVIHPGDGEPVSLFETNEVYASRVSTLEKSFCEQYGVTYPGEIFANKSRSRELLNASSASDDLTELTRITMLNSIVGQAPDDIKKIEANVFDLAVKHAAAMVLAKTDADFEELKAKAIADFKGAGADKVTEWYTNAWNAAKEQVGVK